MSVLITDTSVVEASENMLSKNYFQRLKTTTIKGKTSCEQRKRLLNFMILQVISTENIEVSEGDCDCLKDEFEFTQSCTETPINPEYFRIDGNGNLRDDGQGNLRIYQ